MKQQTSRRDFLMSVGGNLLAVPILPYCATLTIGAKVDMKPCPLLGDGAGIAVSPDEGWREQTADYTFLIKLGKEGLPLADSIGILNGSLMDRWQFAFPSHFWQRRNPWQANDPNQSNYLTATCSRGDVGIRVTVGEPLPGRKGHGNWPSFFVSGLHNRKRAVLELRADQELDQGDIITVHWRNVRAPAYAMRYFFMAFRFSALPKLDRDLPIRKGEFDKLPSIRIKGHSASALHVTCRPLHAVDESFSLNVAAIDRYGNPAEDFEGSVQLEADAALKLPASITFTRENRGCKRIRGLSGTRPGWYRITATQGSISGKSNYIVVSTERPPARLYFGDMHTHTLDCDGTNDIREHFYYAPNIAGLDFGAVSCHAEYFGCRAAWQRYLKETARANRPGEFVTFPGYEWAQQGHINAYFLSEKETVLIWGEKRMKAIGHPPDEPAFRVGAAGEKELMAILRDLDQPSFAIAHVHTAYTQGIDDSILWLDEIYSCHRRSRTKRENALRRNLARGLRLGVVAGSDMHRLTMGHLCREPGKRWPQGGWERCQFQTAGLQATYATELTREALYAGMRERCTYGTTGARIVLLFRCGKSPMGSQVVMQEKAQPSFEFDIGGTTPLKEVAICRYDGTRWSEPFKRQSFDTDRCDGNWKDSNFAGTGIYYVRVTQSNGEQAWSSPIWVSGA